MTTPTRTQIIRLPAAAADVLEPHELQGPVCTCGHPLPSPGDAWPHAVALLAASGFEVLTYPQPDGGVFLAVVSSRTAITKMEYPHRPETG